jgi:hypothetical protein
MSRGLVGRSHVQTIALLLSAIAASIEPRRDRRRRARGHRRLLSQRRRRTHRYYWHHPAEADHADGPNEVETASRPPGRSSCGGDLSVGPVTSCGFAQNVEQAYDQTKGGNRAVTAFSPATGVSCKIDCTGGSPHACTGGTTNGGSLYFPVRATTSPGVTTASPTTTATVTTTSAPPSVVSPTGNLTACDQNISAGPDTTCPFAENVFVAHAADYQANGEQSNNTVNANSPVTQQSCNMGCANDGVTVGCAGGNNSFVTFHSTLSRSTHPDHRRPQSQRVVAR